MDRIKPRTLSGFMELLPPRQAQMRAVMKVLRETPTYAFDRMSCLTAVDYKEYYEMVYCLYSRRYDLWVTVKVKLDHDNPEVESMTQIWEGTNFEERETYDLMGIKFLNHPDLRRILLPDNSGFRSLAEP